MRPMDAEGPGASYRRLLPTTMEGTARLFGHDWKHGTAKVIDRNLMASGDAVSSVPGKHRYVVDVDNPTGEPFRAEIQDPEFRSEGYVVAQVGDEVAVLVDYKRQKAKLDKDDPARHSDPRGASRALDAKFESELADSPGTPAAQASERAGAGGPKITINGKTFEGPMDKAELQQRLAEADKSPKQG
jgi:hypothetical protein